MGITVRGPDKNLTVRQPYDSDSVGFRNGLEDMESKKTYNSGFGFLSLQPIRAVADRLKVRLLSAQQLA